MHNAQYTHVVVIWPFVFGSSLLFDLCFFVLLLLFHVPFIEALSLGSICFDGGFFVAMSAVCVYCINTQPHHLLFPCSFISIQFLIIVTQFFLFHELTYTKMLSRMAFCSIISAKFEETNKYWIRQNQTKEPKSMSIPIELAHWQP